MRVKIISQIALIVYMGLMSAKPVKSDVNVWDDTFKSLPKDWKVQGKILTKSADFYVKDGVLHMDADNASASLVGSLANINLSKTPIMKWCWLVSEFPENADGRDSSKDDQAIGIYISTSGTFSRDTLAYRWETNTPVGASGKVRYGISNIKWFANRNKDSVKDLKPGTKCLEEEVNVAEDFKKEFKYVPKDLSIAISSNSQYTKSQAKAELFWLKFEEAKDSKE